MIAITGPVVEEVEGMTVVEEVEGTIVISGPASLVSVREVVVDGVAKTSRGEEEEGGERWLPGRGHQRTPRK